MKILGFDGSTHKRGGSVTRLLHEALKAAADEAPHFGETVSSEIITLLDVCEQPDVPFYDYKIPGQPDPVKAIFEKMRDADGFIFATPVNWYNVSSPMKFFIDWLTDLVDPEWQDVMEGKPAGIIAHCNDDGGNQAAMSMMAPLFHFGAAFGPYAPFYRNELAAEKSADRWQMTHQLLVGQNVVRMIACLRHNHRGWHLTDE